MSHTLLSLNYDVLSTILPLISSQDAAQLALTCRDAYSLALPRFLSDVSLGGLYHKPGGSAVAQLKAFCNFALAPAPSWHGAPAARLDGLRSLEVMRDAVRVRKDGAWVTDTSAVALLSSALERAHGLRRLTLWGSAALFAACPTFGQGSSASIDALVLGGDIAPLPLLARAFPHVRSLEFVGVNGSCAPDWAFFAPDSDPEALGPWRESLERVDTGFSIMSFTCPVRRVEVKNPVMDTFDSVYPAREFLGGARPVVLSLPVSVGCSPEEIGAVLELAAPGMRFLEITGDRCEGLKAGVDWTKVSSLSPFVALCSGLTPIVVYRIGSLLHSRSSQRSPSTAYRLPLPPLWSQPSHPGSQEGRCPQHRHGRR